MIREWVEEHIIERYRGLPTIDDPAAALRPVGNVQRLDETAPPRHVRFQDAQLLGFPGGQRDTT